MGAYNTLVVNSNCAGCGKETSLRIQFKYGELWLYEYSLKDAIIWKPGEEYKKKITLVVADGCSEECPFCGENIDYLIFIEFGIITYFMKNSGEYNFLNMEDNYIILKP